MISSLTRERIRLPFRRCRTSCTVNMIVKDQNRVESKEYGEEIFAENFFKKVDEIQDSVRVRY